MDIQSLLSELQDWRCKEGLVDQAERQAGAQEGCACLQEIHSSEADECSYAEEVVGDDEGTLGFVEEACLIATVLTGVVC